MLLAICTTPVKKRVNKRFQKRKKKVTKNLLQGDSNPDPQLELTVNASIHWPTSVNADNSSLKKVYIPSLW